MGENRLKVLVFLPIFIFLFYGCERRLVEKATYVYVKILFDWGGTESRPDHVKIVLFPTDGSRLYSLLVQSEGDVLSLQTGAYYALLYNWRSDSDGQSILFKNTETYDTYEAFTDSIKGAIFDDIVFMQPDSLYSWSTGDNLLSITETSVTVSPLKAYAPEDTFFLFIKPDFLLDSYSFFIPLNGIKYLKAIHAKISGVAESVNLYTKHVSDIETSMSVGLRKADGGVNCHISTFGFVPEKRNILTLRFSLCDGTVWVQEFDLTAEIATGKINDFTTPIDIPTTQCEEESKGGAFKDPGVSKWKEVTGNLKL